MDLSLNPTEQRIFDLLRQVVRSKAPETTLRVAGGWVRDKLMGKESNDIDIAIDNMTGEEFANLVVQYTREHGMKGGTVAVVEANPEQSKHLATAMVRVFGLPIDFVNLRTETYADSRIPGMQMGTAEEDASRRDLTINSLFYNINTSEIEDYIGGLQDLKRGIARTPMDPVQTFLDDPLRILRTVRFAARYNLDLDPSLVEAAHDPRVQQAFKNKVSQERVWTELAGKKEGEKWKPGAMIGPNPGKAAELLKELGLMEPIFDLSPEEMQQMSLPEEVVPWETEQDNPHHTLNIWGHTLATLKALVDRTHEDIRADEETYLVRNIAALLHDIGKRYKGIQGIHEQGHTTYHGHEELSGQMAEAILTRLKAPKKIIQRVKTLIDVHLKPHELLRGGGGRARRRFVRNFEDWPHSMDLAIADALGKQKYTPEEAEQEAQKYEDLRTKIQESMPTGGPVFQRPITGRDLIEIGFQPGPIMGEIMRAIDEAMLDNPDLTKEEALDIARTFPT